MSYRRGASDVCDVAIVSWITSENLPEPLISQAWLLCGASDVDDISYEQGYPPWERIRLNENAAHRCCNYHNYRNRSGLARALNEETRTKKDSPPRLLFT